jgi:hypothetical protein
MLVRSLPVLVLALALPSAAEASTLTGSLGLSGALDGVLIACAAFGTGWLMRRRATRDA